MADTYSESATPAELAQLNQLLYGFATSQAIYVAANLKIADLIGDVPKTTEEVARATKAHAPSIRRLLRMLTSVSVFLRKTRTADFSRPGLALSCTAIIRGPLGH